jgi:hypothetical protein
MTTPWPTNGSFTPSSSPLFMMIPYPSSSPSGAPNATFVELPVDATATIVAGTAIGALGIGGLFVAAQYLKPQRNERRRAEDEGKDEEEKDKEEDETTAGIRLGEGLSYVCVATADLEEVVRLLTVFQKRFHVLAADTLSRIE